MLIDPVEYIRSTPGSLLVEWLGRSIPVGKYTFIQDGSLVFEVNYLPDTLSVRTGWKLENKDFAGLSGQAPSAAYTSTASTCALYGTVGTHHLLGTADTSQLPYQAGDFDKYATWRWEAPITDNEVGAVSVTFTSGYQYTVGEDGLLSVYEEGQFLSPPTVTLTFAP